MQYIESVKIIKRRYKNLNKLSASQLPLYIQIVHSELSQSTNSTKKIKELYAKELLKARSEIGAIKKWKPNRQSLANEPIDEDLDMFVA